MTWLALFLAYVVLLVNAWTDAPNSIATAVSSGAIEYKKATYLCGAFNFLGALIGYLTNLSIAKYVFTLTDFKEHTAIGVCIVFLTMTIYGIATYFVGLPSSESHAMLCGIVGVGFAITKSLSNAKKVGDVFVFMVFSCILSFILGYTIRRILRWNLPYKMLQILSCSLTSYMHGYQSGLKFIGIILFLFGISAQKENIPFLIPISVSIVLGLGALMGGKRIIHSLGDNLAKIDDRMSFSSDIGTYISLLICSLLGMPVSSGNIKCLAIMGAGYGNKERINKKTATKLIISFVAVFPICFLLSYLLMRFFLYFKA
jgi:PiT family inorganic phosphate transporter